MKAPIITIIISAIVLSIISIAPFLDNYTIFLCYSIVISILTLFIFKQKLANYKGLDFSFLFLCGYIIRVVIPGIVMPIQLLSGESFIFLNDRNIVDDALFSTAAWMNIYYMLFYCALRKVSKGYTIDNIILPYLNKYKISYISISLFIVGFSYKIFTHDIPAGLITSSVNELFGQFTTLALILQVFNASLKYTKVKQDILIILVVAEMLRAVFFDFYKSAIMMPFVLYLLYCFMASKHQGKKLLTIKNILSVVVFFSLISNVIYPFMTIKRVEAGFRATVGGGVATKSYSNIDILNRVISGDLIKEEKNSTFDRFNALPANAYFYKESVSKNWHTTEVLKNNIELLVPKFINPNKHGSQAGLMAYAYAQYGSLSFFKNSLSNNYIGQFASSYLIGGEIAVIIFALLNGIMFGAYYNYMMKNISNLFALYCLARIFLSALFSIEEIHDGGALRIGCMLVYMVIVALTNNFLKLRS